ncbi:FadR/GntR family transcriptional regulator [Nocardia jiangxiensis]|uniref:FadR/GntR family transcriptional regulator n=1 Tax=Nocardia jiangxiensis TaxID=282685 RepID=A0ABW6SC57_9NOCA
MVHGPARRALKQSDIVAREITRRIVAENLPEGTRLPHEKEMVEEYQVGRSTLREALRLLETRGVVSIRSGRDGGPVVRRPRPTDLGEALTLLLQFEGVNFSEVFAARRILVPRLARRAAERITPPTLAALRECLDRMDAYLDEPAVFRAERQRFDKLISNASESPVLELLNSAVGSVAEDADRGADPDRFTRTQRAAMAREDQAVYDALAEHDPDATQTAMAVRLASDEKRANAARRDIAGRSVQWALVEPTGS